ncbi:MAG: glycerate kinase [Chitinophagaceae bacterium]|nr:glycerate kinase [Chitinophagaceae bacterium]
MHILVAPNAFKNALDAYRAAAAIAKGLLRSRLKCTIKCFPVADGGDGTAYLLGQQMQAGFFSVPVLDPLGRNIQAGIGIAQNGTTALIELADASGLRLLSPSRYNPLRCTTYGTGQLIQAALEANVSTIILGVGGSATVDGGTGILRALGFRFLDEEGADLKYPGDFKMLASYSDAFMDPRILEKKIIILSDVSNPLLGVNGAATVFGPQKGASETDIQILEEGLGRWASLILKNTGKDISTMPYGGAAGGVAAGLHGLLNAQLTNGIEFFLDATQFDEEVKHANLVITGEGSLDLQTLEGKGPFGVAQRARKYSVPVIGMAGKVDNEALPELKKTFDSIMCINDKNASEEEMIANTAVRLEMAGYELGNRIA